MADEVKPTNDNVVETKQTVEVLSPTGETLHRGDSSISSIFDKIEKAKNEGGNVSDVIKEVSKPAERVVEKKVEKQVPDEETVKQKPAESDLDKKLGEALDKKNEQEEISRGKLREQNSEKKEDDKQPEDKKLDSEKKPDDDVPEDELQVLPHDKPKTAKRIQALLKKIDSINSDSAKTRAEATEKATKLAELEAKLNEVKTVDPKTEEAVKKQLDELSMYRRRYDLEKDPEVNTKFTSRIDSAETSIISTLKAHRAGEGLLNLVKEEGGWLKFSGSNKPITLADGSTMTAAALSDSILAALPLADRKGVESSMYEQLNAKREKDAFFDKEVKTANEYFTKLDEDKVKQSQAQQQQVQEVAKVIENWHKTVTEKEAWLKEKEVPANATADQKAAIEDDNKYTKQLKQLITKSLSTKDVNESLDMVLDSVRYYQERRENTKIQAQLTSVKAELAKAKADLDKVRGSSRTLPKTGSISAGGTAQTASNRSVPKSLEEAFDAIEKSEVLTNE